MENFGLRYIYSQNFACTRFLNCNGSYSGKYSVRPIISLTPNIKISKTGGSIDNPRTLSLK